MERGAHLSPEPAATKVATVSLVRWPARELYSTAFYEALRAGAKRSAGVVVPLVLSLPLGPVDSVVDLGCGVGSWLCEFANKGVKDVLGVDGDYVDRETLEIPSDSFVAGNLGEPLDLGRRFDLVVSLEVAEHIAAAQSNQFLENLAAHGDVILFSAAIPEQGGSGHVNERWQSHWVALFAERGYQLFDVVRPAVWSDDRVDTWYRQNTMVFATGAKADRLASTPVKAMGVTDVVHPETYLWKLTGTRASDNAQGRRWP